MKKTTLTPYIINSISALHRLLGLPKPKHPLVSLIRFEAINCFNSESLRSVAYNFYCIAVKKNFEGKMKYGQQYYDFDEGVMTFFSPMQVVTTDVVEGMKLSGYWLVVHPDFIRNYPLGQAIKEYGYFSYAANEALYLSEDEENKVTTIMQHIESEYISNIDNFSQDVMISHTALLLSYCNRFYHRQFITRKAASNDLLIKLESLISNYFETEKVQQSGLITVHYISNELHVSADYLSDMLRHLTGQNTQQHIHNYIIEKAKEKLTTSSLSVSEISNQLGFEFAQSFNKLFKNKTNVTPLEFRELFKS